MASSTQFLSNVLRINLVQLSNISGKTVDITDMIREINIYENIYNNSIIGTIDIIDSHDYPQTFPLLGEESILIDIILPGLGDSYNLKLSNYKIFKISDREIANDKIQHYKLWFISSEAITNFETKISKSWKSVTTSKIIKDVFTLIKSDKILELDETIGTTSYISTNFSPFEILNYIASHRSINSSRLSDYAFFESFDLSNKSSGTKFNFKSLSKLQTITSDIKFTFNPVTMNNSKGFAGNVQPFNIENIEFNKGFNLIDSKVSGLYNQTNIYYDILRKRYVVQKISYDDVFNESLSSKESKKIFTVNNNNYGENLNLIYCTTFPTTISNNKEMGNINNKGTEDKSQRSDNGWIGSNGDSFDRSSTLLEETLFRRKVLLHSFETNKIYLNDISGNYKYSVGRTVELLKPHIVFDKEAVKTEYGLQDSLISGTYLITKSRHRIFREEGLNWRYKTYLEISKNTFKTDLKK